MYQTVFRAIAFLVLVNSIVLTSEAQFLTPNSGDCFIALETEDAPLDSCHTSRPISDRFNYSASDLYLEWSSQGYLSDNCMDLNAFDTMLGSLHLCGLWWDQDSYYVLPSWHPTIGQYDDEVFTGVYESELGYLYIFWSSVIESDNGTNSASGGLPSGGSSY